MNPQLSKLEELSKSISAKYAQKMICPPQSESMVTQQSDEEILTKRKAEMTHR
jgi:hypothetical protein